MQLSKKKLEFYDSFPLNWLPSFAGVPLLSMVSFVFVCILEHSVFHLILATVTPHLVYHVARLVVGLRGAKPILHSAAPSDRATAAGTWGESAVYYGVRNSWLQFVPLISHQPAVFFLRTNQPSVISQQYFFSEQISTSHQPPAKRTGCGFLSA
jgi:hypothetical protein